VLFSEQCLAWSDHRRAASASLILLYSWCWALNAAPHSSLTLQHIMYTLKGISAISLFCQQKSSASHRSCCPCAATAFAPLSKPGRRVFVSERACLVTLAHLYRCFATVFAAVAPDATGLLLYYDLTDNSGSVVTATRTQQL